MFWVIIHVSYEALTDLTESGQRVYPCSLQNSSSCCLLSQHWTAVTQCHWKPCTLMQRSLLHVSQMMSYALDHDLFQAFSRLFFPSFGYRLILISAVQRTLFQKWSDWVFGKSNLALFGPCCAPSVFALVKSSLDCWLWQWHVCLLESVLLLVGYCERVFIYHGEDSLIIITVVRGRPGLLCCKAHQCCLSSSECNKLMIWPLLMFLLFLWWICFVFEA